MLLSPHLELQTLLTFPTRRSSDLTAPVPIDPTGPFAVTSSYTLAATPPVAADVLGELVAATDGPDDPSRFLIERADRKSTRLNLHSHVKLVCRFLLDKKK